MSTPAHPLPNVAQLLASLGAVPSMGQQPNALPTSNLAGAILGSGGTPAGQGSQLFTSQPSSNFSSISISPSSGLSPQTDACNPANDLHSGTKAPAVQGAAPLSPANYVKQEAQPPAPTRTAPAAEVRPAAAAAAGPRPMDTGDAPATASTLPGAGAGPSPGLQLPAAAAAGAPSPMLPFPGHPAALAGAFPPGGLPPGFPPGFPPGASLPPQLLATLMSLQPMLGQLQLRAAMNEVARAAYAAGQASMANLAVQPANSLHRSRNRLSSNALGRTSSTSSAEDGDDVVEAGPARSFQLGVSNGGVSKKAARRPAQDGRPKVPRDPATISKVQQCALAILELMGTKEMFERSIREALGNNPDTSKALRLLVSQGKLERCGAGGRGDPFTYRVLSPRGGEAGAAPSHDGALASLVEAAAAAAAAEEGPST